MTSKAFVNSAWLALVASLLSGCQTSPVASIAPPVVSNAVIKQSLIPAPLPPLPPGMAVTRSLLVVRPAAVPVQPVIVPPNFLITISITTGRGCCTNMAGTFWYAGVQPGSRTLAEFDPTTNGFHTFSNQWDSRFPCFVTSQGMFAYSNAVVITNHGMVATNLYYNAGSPVYYDPIVTSNLVKPFVYLSTIWNNTSALPVAHIATFCVWGVSNVNYQVLKSANLLGTFEPIDEFTGQNAPYSWVEPSQGMMFYRAVVR